MVGELRILEELVGTPGPTRVLPIPEGISCLSFPPHAPAEICHALPPDASGEPRRDAIDPEVRRPRRALIIEPVEVEGQRGLLMLRPDHFEISISGVPAPTLGHLRLRDQLMGDARRILHLTDFHTPPVGEAGGRGDCIMCRVPFSPGDRVYRCPHCQNQMHFTDELECALATDTCIVCRNPVHFDGGYLYIPEGLEVPPESEVIR